MAWKQSLTLLACAIIVISCAYILYDLNGESLDFSDSEIILVVTDSMDGDVSEYAVDSYPADTLAIVKSIPAHEIRFIRVGQVVAYHDGDKLITHRVVDVDLKNHTLTLKGDNASAEEKIGYEDVVGVVVGTNHWLGSAFSTVKSNLASFICVLAVIMVCVTVYGLRNHLPRIERQKGLRRGVAYSLAIAAVAGIVLIGAGYAYSTSTENTDNEVSSEYVVLTLGSYTFVDDGKFEYYTMTGNDGITRYCIVDYGENNRVQQLITDSDRKLAPGIITFWGVKIGESELSMSQTGFDEDYLTIKLQMNSDGDHYFTIFDTSRAQWKYFVKLYYVESEVQTDIHWIASDGNQWYSIQGEGDSGDYVKLDSSKTYKMELYFAGPDFVFGGKHYAGSQVKPVASSPTAKVIKDGRIKFVFDSTPTITFHKNNNAATGSMEDQVVTYNEETALEGNGFSLDNHTFLKWNTKADGTGISYGNEDAIAIDRDTTLYAIWQQTV